MENGDDGHHRRGPEEAEERAVLGIRVATEFLCRVYLRAHRSMRDAESLASWRVAVVSLLGRHAAARRWFLEFLRDRPAHLAAFLTRCPSAEARETFACLVAAALKFAVSLDEGGASADAVPAAAARAEMGIEPDTTAAAAASSRRQPGRAARLVDRVLQNLVQALHDAATRPVRVASPAYCFHVLAEYASLGAAQRFQLLRYDVMDRLVEFTCAAYHAPARGANASSPETRGAYRLLSALVRSCDVSEPRRFFAAACAQRAAAHAGGAVVWRVGDLQEDAAADGSTAPTAPPSPFALDGGVFAVPTSARAKLHEPMFAEMLVDLATESEAVMSALLHLCWRWETMSRLAVAAVLDAVEQQSSTDLPGTLRVARRLLELDDWCARIRAGYLLEGKMFQHPHALAQGRPRRTSSWRPRGEDETHGRHRTSRVRHVPVPQTVSGASMAARDDASERVVVGKRRRAGGGFFLRRARLVRGRIFQTGTPTEDARGVDPGGVVQRRDGNWRFHIPPVGRVRVERCEPRRSRVGARRGRGVAQARHRTRRVTSMIDEGNGIG